MVLAIGAVGAIGVYYTQKKLAETASGVGQAINPINQDNIFYSGVNAMGKKITGSQSWTLGGAIYEVVNGTPEQQSMRAEEALFIKSIGG